MTKHCKNCDEELTGNYCSNCGQQSNTDRINFHYLKHDIQHGLFHFEKGILFSSKELIIRPGNSIREFLQGKRVKHFKPLSLVLLLAGIYGFLSHYFTINLLSNNFEVTGSGAEFIRTKSTLSNMSEWISRHYSILALLQIPIFTIGTYLCFHKFNYNFIEHLIINAFIASQKLLIHLSLFPIYYFFNNSPHLKIIARTTDLSCYAFAIFTLIQLFSETSLVNRVWRAILSMIVSFAIVYIILVSVSKLLLS